VLRGVRRRAGAELSSEGVTDGVSLDRAGRMG
jgi:hypothetical protein